jgi:hypothetical protein
MKLPAGSGKCRNPGAPCRPLEAIECLFDGVNVLSLCPCASRRWLKYRCWIRSLSALCFFDVISSSSQVTNQGGLFALT